MDVNASDADGLDEILGFSNKSINDFNTGDFSRCKNKKCNITDVYI